MKKLLSFFVFVLLSYLASAQIYKTINVTTAGTLTTLLTATEKSTVTNLTVTGNIDARDVKIMRDDLPYLNTINLSNSTINSYFGKGGTKYVYGKLGTDYYSPLGELNIEYKADEIPLNSFYDDMNSNSKISLLSITLPSNIKSIGEKAFYGCNNLHTVINISDLESIGTSAFYNCSKLSGFDLGTKITSINNSVFFNCNSLTHIDIPYSVSSIGDGAFSGCSSLSSVKIGKAVNYIGIRSFAGCVSLTNLYLPNEVSKISEASFAGCTSLKSIILPNTLSKIDISTFWGCTNLQYIKIPSSVTYIYSSAFYNCINLKIIHCLGVNAPTIGSYNTFEGVNLDYFYVPRAGIDTYRIQGYLNSFNIVASPNNLFRLALKSSINGAINYLSDFGETLSFDFTPTSGWSVNTVFYNEVDVTNNLIEGVFTTPPITSNSVLSVSFVSITTGAPEFENRNIKVFSNQSSIIIEGTISGEKISLYTLEGKLIDSNISVGGRMTMFVQPDAIYFVKTSGRTFKVML